MNGSDLFSGGGGKLIRTDIITATGTYTKPSDIDDDDLVIIDMWGGGQAGVPSGGYEGGMPGAWARFRIFADELRATTQVVIGAGGIGNAAAGNGASGGNTTFDMFAVVGGTGNAGFESGLKSLMLNFSAESGGATNDRQTTGHMFPGMVAYELGKYIGGISRPNEGGNNGPSNAVAARWRGGWGGYSATNNATGPQYYGQLSHFGGNGGNGVTTHADHIGPAGNGAARGGGGGNSISGSKAGDGGRGEIMVRYYRGVSR